MMAAQLAGRRTTDLMGHNLSSPPLEKNISVMFLQNCDLQDKNGKYCTPLKA